MEALRAAAAATPSVAELSWRTPDELADWTIRAGDRELSVHIAVMASGARRSERLREAALKDSDAGRRVTDVSSLLPLEAREAVMTDPFFPETLDLILDWAYGLVELSPLPSFANVAKEAAKVPVTAAATPAAGAMAASPVAVESSGDMLSYFSTALFGTPSKPPPSPANGNGTNGTTVADQIATVVPSAKSRAVKAAQVPLLWQLGDALALCGLKGLLIRIFEEAPLPPSFVLSPPAYQRLKMCAHGMPADAHP